MPDPVVECSLARTESIFSCFVVARHQSINTFQMPIFYFDLTSDVTGDPEVNKVRLGLTNVAGLSNAIWILNISPVVPEIVYSAPLSGAHYRNIPVGSGLSVLTKLSAARIGKLNKYVPPNVTNGYSDLDKNIIFLPLPVHTPAVIR